MTDREKVIKGLECCEAKPLPKCEACPYADAAEGTCFTMDKMHQDALALLKEQEPVDVDEWPDEFLCPTCKTRLAGRSHYDCVLLETNEIPNFCWKCGQAVKWE